MDINSNLSNDQIINNLISKELKFYKLDELLNNETKANELRIRAIEKILNTSIILKEFNTQKKLTSYV